MCIGLYVFQNQLAEQLNSNVIMVNVLMPNSGVTELQNAVTRVMKRIAVSVFLSFS